MAWGNAYNVTLRRKKQIAKIHNPGVDTHTYAHMYAHMQWREKKIKTKYQQLLSMNSRSTWCIFMSILLIRNSEFFSEVQYNILKPSNISSLKWWSSDSCIKWRLWHFTLPLVKWIIRFFHLQNELLNYHSGVMHWNSLPLCCSSIIKPCSWFSQSPSLVHTSLSYTYITVNPS